jgi:phage gp29-like protein
MRTKLGLRKPKPGAKLLVAPAAPISSFGGFGNGGALQARQVPPKRTADDIVALAAAAEHLTQPAFDEMVAEIRTALQSATSLEDVRARLRHLQLDDSKMADALRLALVIAKLSGRENIIDAAQA